MSQIKRLAKRVSNYELFFDLAFVLAIKSLNGSMHLEHVGLEQISLFVISNVILMTIWVNEVTYYQKYGDSRRADIYTVLALMFVIGHLAMNFNYDPATLEVTSSIVVPFHTLLFFAYGIIALQYFLKGRTLGFSKDIKVSIAF